MDDFTWYWDGVRKSAGLNFFKVDIQFESQSISKKILTAAGKTQHPVCPQGSGSHSGALYFLALDKSLVGRAACPEPGGPSPGTRRAKPWKPAGQPLEPGLYHRPW